MGPSPTLATVVSINANTLVTRHDRIIGTHREVVDRVARGERVTVTRSGKPVAELRPLGPDPVSVEELARRRAHLPLVDPVALRADVDAMVDASL